MSIASEQTGELFAGPENGHCACPAIADEKMSALIKRQPLGPVEKAGSDAVAAHEPDITGHKIDPPDPAVERFHDVKPTPRAQWAAGIRRHPAFRRGARIQGDRLQKRETRIG